MKAIEDRPKGKIEQKSSYKKEEWIKGRENNKAFKIEVSEIPEALLDAFNHNYDPKLDRPTDLMHVENYLLSYIQGPIILA